MKQYYRSGYLSNAWHKPSRDYIVHLVARRLREWPDFTHFLVRGLSGALIGPALAEGLNKGLLISRKPDNSHGGSIEGYPAVVKDYVFVDDLTCSGSTIQDAIASMDGVKPVGCFFYSQHIDEVRDTFDSGGVNHEVCPQEMVFGLSIKEVQHLYRLVERATKHNPA